MKQTIAIQGIQGSNHHKVVQAYFWNEVHLDECLSFNVLVSSLMSEKSNYAIMAIENTIAGSIIPNYALIDANNIDVPQPIWL